MTATEPARPARRRNSGIAVTEHRVSSGVSPPAPVLLAALALLLVLVFLDRGGARAHFQLNMNIRIVHVEHLDDGLRVYLRLPLAYVLAGLTGPERADGTVEPAPFTVNELREGALMHSIDLEALRRDPAGLARLIAEGHVVTAEGRALAGEVSTIRVQLGLEQSPFSTLAEAERSMAGPLYPADRPPAFVGDLVVDAVITYRAGRAVPRYAFGGRLDPGLEGQDQTANVLIDYFPGGDPLILRARGLLAEPIEVSRSPLAAAGTFVIEGIRHILEGTDHVLFVLCLTIGAFSLTDLLLRVTGFTVGHTVTLIAGFLGYVPSAAWFVPVVETGIAISIVYAGTIALMQKPQGATLLVTALIGLLHGLGFSFVLGEILKVDAPNLWQSLLAFNLGVELGQVAIVLLAYPAIRLLGRLGARAGTAGRWAVALPCIAVAAAWTGQRLLLVAETI